MTRQDTSAPSAFELERSVSAYQQLRQTYIDDPDLTADEHVISDALALQGIDHPEELAQRVIDAQWWARKRADEADEMRRLAAARRDRYLLRIEQLRDLGRRLLAVIDQRSVRGRYARGSIMRTQPGVLVTDPELLPEDCWRVHREPNLTAIRERLQAGEVIPGAVLSNAGETLTVRGL